MTANKVYQVVSSQACYKLTFVAQYTCTCTSVSQPSPGTIDTTDLLNPGMGGLSCRLCKTGKSVRM